MSFCNVILVKSLLNSLLFHPECFAVSYSCHAEAELFQLSCSLWCFSCLSLLMSECASVHMCHGACASAGCVYMRFHVCARTQVCSFMRIVYRMLAHARWQRLHLLERRAASCEPAVSQLTPPFHSGHGVALHNDSQGLCCLGKIKFRTQPRVVALPPSVFFYLHAF